MVKAVESILAKLHKQYSMRGGSDYHPGMGNVGEAHSRWNFSTLIISTGVQLKRL